LRRRTLANLGLSGRNRCPRMQVVRLQGAAIDVTGDRRYFNSNLWRNRYKNWKP
jgi:CYTH domain-containing protein